MSIEIFRKMYNAKGEWIGMEITEQLTREEAEKRYPGVFKKAEQEEERATE